MSLVCLYCNMTFEPKMEAGLFTKPFSLSLLGTVIMSMRHHTQL